MKKTEAIKLNKEFKSLYYRGGCQVSKRIVLYYRKNKANRNINRLGLTVSKKVGNAVTRNRIRRLIKENYRLREENIESGYDFVFVARKSAEGQGFYEIGKDMDYIFRKCGLFIEKNLS